MGLDYRGFTGILAMSTLVLCNSLCAGASAEKVVGARIDYVTKLNELVHKEADEELNAEPFYRRALELYVEPTTKMDPNILACWPTELNDAQQEEMSRWIEANSGVLAQLRLGAQRPCYWPWYQGDDIWTLYGVSDGLMKEIRLGQALAFRAELEAQKGRIREAIDDLLVCCRVGVDLKSRLFSGEQLSGALILLCGLRTGFQVLDRGAATDQALLGFFQGQLRRLAKRQDSRVDLAAEQLVISVAIREIYAQWPGSGGTERTRVLDEAISSLLSDRLYEDFGITLSAAEVYSSIYERTPEQMEELVQETLAYCNSVVVKTPFQQHEEKADWDDAVRRAAAENALLLSLLPPFRGLSEMRFRCQAESDALITTVALMRYKNDRDGFPDDLQEAVARGYLHQLPMDPYSDRPLIYRRTASGFVLYSVGADFQDNGGRHSVKWGREPQGGDFVFWPLGAFAR